MTSAGSPRSNAVSGGSSVPPHLTRSFYQPQLLASYERLPHTITVAPAAAEDHHHHHHQGSPLTPTITTADHTTNRLSESTGELSEIRMPTTATMETPTTHNISKHTTSFPELPPLPILQLPMPSTSSFNSPKHHSPLLVSSTVDIVNVTEPPPPPTIQLNPRSSEDTTHPTATTAASVAPSGASDSDDGGAQLDQFDFFQIIDFLLGLCGALQRCGMPNSRLEYQITWAAESFGIDASVAVFPTYISANFRQRNSHVSFTYNLSVEYSWNLDKLDLVDSLAIKVAEHKLTLDEGIVELKRIMDKPPLYPDWLRLILFTVTSGVISPLFFKGGLVELAAALVIGFLVGLMTLFGERAPTFNRVLEAVSSVVAAAIVTILDKTQSIGPINPTSIMLGAVVWALPGLQINTATSDLASHMMVSGTSRLIYAFLVIFEMGFGFALGSKISYFLTDYSSVETDPTLIPSIAISGWFTFLFVPIISIGFGMLLGAAPRQYIIILVSASFSIIVSMTGSFLGGELSTVLAQSVVVMVGNIYAKIFDHPAFVPNVIGSLLLVPSSLGVRGISMAIMSNDVLSAVSFTFSLITTAVCIVVGGFVGNMLIYPTRAFDPHAR